MNTTIWDSPRAFAVILLVTLIACVTSANADQREYAQSSKNVGDLSSGIADRFINVTIPVGDYEIADAPEGQDIFVDGFGSLLVPGKPKLPSKIFAIAIPPGAELVGVDFDPGQGVDVPGMHQIAPTPLPRVIGQEDPERYAEERQRYEANFDAVYGSDNPYPRNVGEFVRTAGYRKYNLVDVRITPFTYRPESGRLTYHPQVNVCVTYRLADEHGEIMVDNQPKTEAVADRIIFNNDQTKDWYPQGGPRSKGLYDFVIITLDSLTSSVTPLVNWETAKGRTVTVVTTSWIDANYNGGHDLASDIRAFLRDKYPSGEWGIEDVLLVGHYDDVPMRRCEQDLGYGKPETDYYYAELSLPDSDSWDDDGDHLYGEDSDSIDYYGEVNVGRIPYSSSSTVQSICEKSVAYEQNDDPTFKKNILLMAGFFWNDDPNPRTDNAVLMEAKVDQPWMSDWTMTRMYEEGHSTYAMDHNLTYNNVVSVWSSNTFAFVNWAGHGSPTSSHIYFGTGEGFATNSTCPNLNDNYPAIIFADACSNHDTDHDNIGWAMMGQGGVGFVGSTKVALGCPGWDDQYDGSSQSLDYFFTTYVTSGDYTQGQAHQQALTDMYTYGLWDYFKYETFEWGALLGNPNLGMGVASALSISFPDGLPEYLDPSTPTTFTVRIADGLESYVTDSGVLHYRYDGGTFLTSNLVHDTGNLYDATLPAAACDDTPEFYISAQGDLGTTVLSPAGAPAGFYTALVGEFVALFEDNFDTNPGWTTEGDWAFGTPTGGGGEYGEPDPISGYTGNNVYGYNLNGDYPNSLSEKDLTSEAIDCTDMSDVHLTFWRWLGVEQPQYDHAYVLVSNNGTSWTTVWENSGTISDSTWVEMDLDISAVADGQPTVYLRWTMGSTDGGWRYCGWNIDDVRLTTFHCEDVTCSEPADGDINGDGPVNGIDIQLFVNGILGEPTFDEMCHGDFDEDMTLSVDDIDGMVSALLAP